MRGLSDVWVKHSKAADIGLAIRERFGPALIGPLTVKSTDDGEAEAHVQTLHENRGLIEGWVRSEYPSASVDVGTALV
jgi:hypothetical protein